MIDVRENCRRVVDRIHNAAARSRRDPSTIRLIAVAKTVPAERICDAIQSGVTEIGENRVQEALLKRPALERLLKAEHMPVQLTWHFIGSIQTNKAKKVVENFDWIHSLDRPELAEKVNGYAAQRLPVLIEVELGNETTKGGVRETDLPQLVDDVSRYERLLLKGIMAVPPYFDDPQDSRPYFARLRALADRFGLKELSMGMSHDFEVAIEEGATMIRVGTALFGERS